MSPPACPQLFTPVPETKPRTKRTMAHVPYWRSTAEPKTPPRRRPYHTMAARRPKTAPDAPTVKGVPRKSERRKQATPLTVKMMTVRARP